MEILTVNYAIDNLEILSNQPIYLKGILSFQFEDISINHYPKIEYRNDGSSSIWIDVDYGILRFNEPVLSKWHGKRIIIEGILQPPDPCFGGVGHMSLWSASIVATEIDLFSDLARGEALRDRFTER